MTYLEIVNGVLARLREPLTPSVLKSEDHVVNMVKGLVNDAKRHVEMAHKWNATRQLWMVSTSKGDPSYILDETSSGCQISKLAIDGVPLNQWDLTVVVHGNTGSGRPSKWAVDGTDEKGNISLRFDPVPDGLYEIEVLGHRSLPDLKSDDEQLRLPSQPVLYYALALAARERGEVGGQTAQELFSMAQQYIRDAIALDANLSPTENIWVAV